LLSDLTGTLMHHLQVCSKFQVICKKNSGHGVNLGTTFKISGQHPGLNVFISS